MVLRTPLSIYVVFHPGSEASQRHADVIHDWFRLAEDDGDSTEAGIPVWYRCALDGDKLTPDMNWDDASLNAIVVLVSAEMLLEDGWRRAVRTMMGSVAANASHERVLLYSVALCPGASHLTWLFDARQALPGTSANEGTAVIADHWTLAGVLDQLSPPGGTEAASWTIAYPGRGLRRAEHDERHVTPRDGSAAKSGSCPRSGSTTGSRSTSGTCASRCRAADETRTWPRRGSACATSTMFCSG